MTQAVAYMPKKQSNRSVKISNARERMDEHRYFTASHHHPAHHHKNISRRPQARKVISKQAGIERQGSDRMPSGRAKRLIGVIVWVCSVCKLHIAMLRQIIDHLGRSTKKRLEQIVAYPFSKLTEKIFPCKVHIDTGGI